MPYISLLILTFLNRWISVKTSLINTKLGNLVNLGVLFLTMWINSCQSHNLDSYLVLRNKEALERVLRMQKRAARIILEAQRTSRTVTLFNNLRWIPFYNEAYIKRCELAYKRIHGTLPDYLNASLRKNSDAHSRITRNCNLNLLCPLHKTSQRADAPLP